MDQRTIVVTGVSRGLGLEMARGFVAAGHIVVGCARSEDAVSRLRDEFDGPHRFDVVNVASDNQVETWAHDVLSSHGPPSLLVNNAALINANATLWDVSPDEFSRVIDVNIKGTFHTIRHFAPAMIEAGHGIIANFSSGWGRATSPEVAPYCATKWAVEGMTRALSQELPRGLAAVAVNPGIINTEMLQSCFGSMAGSYPTAKEWSERAVPFLLGLNASNNGSQPTI